MSSCHHFFEQVPELYVDSKWSVSQIIITFELFHKLQPISVPESSVKTVVNDIHYCYHFTHHHSIFYFASTFISCSICCCSRSPWQPPAPRRRKCRHPTPLLLLVSRPLSSTMIQCLTLRRRPTPRCPPRTCSSLPPSITRPLNHYQGPPNSLTDLSPEANFEKV